MTGRIGTMSIDGTPISEADRARMAADEALQATARKRAVLVVAGAAQDVDDCRLLLDILGLDPAVVLGKTAKASKPRRTSAKRGSRRGETAA